MLRSLNERGALRWSCETAEIEPMGFHQLRPAYASLYLMSGGSLVSLAKVVQLDAVGPVSHSAL